MTKLRLSLKNLARTGFSLFIIISHLLGCYSSPTPSFLQEDIDKVIRDICWTEYKTEVKVKLSGQTLWVYLPLEDIIEKSDKPQEYVERFVIEQNKSLFNNGQLRLGYLIKPVPEQEKHQETIKYSDDALKKINGVWGVIRRVLFSMKLSKEKEPKFICVVTADIKNGFIIQDTAYYPDLKKVSYGFISPGEFQHRAVQNTEVFPRIIADKDGYHLNYREISMEEFLAWQIQHRIKLKFQKPEVEKNADIDKEILKIIIYTLKTYGFKDFSEVELNNLLTNNKISLNRRAVLERPSE